MIALVREPSGRLKLDHYSPSPLVYLDHAPMMEIAESHAAEFAATLAARSGTLTFSWLHLLEHADVDDRTAALTDALVGRIFPRLAFLEVIPEKVIANEDALLAGGPPLAPHLDNDVLNMFWDSRPPERRLEGTAEGFVHLFRSPTVSAVLRAEWARVAARSVQGISEAAELYRTDSETRARVQRPIVGQRVQMPTRYIYTEAARYLVRTGDTIGANDIRDYFHLVVAVSYCHYVVLNRRWWDAARQIQDKVRAADLLTHTAEVFKVSEIPAFLSRLASDRGTN